MYLRPQHDQVCTYATYRQDVQNSVTAPSAAQYMQNKDMHRLHYFVRRLITVTVT